MTADLAKIEVRVKYKLNWKSLMTKLKTVKRIKEQSKLSDEYLSKTNAKNMVYKAQIL